MRLQVNDKTSEFISLSLFFQALRSPSKLKEQAKVILNSESSSRQASRDQSENVPAKAQEDPRERRPALGRKRARFSLKPNAR